VVYSLTAINQRFTALNTSQSIFNLSALGFYRVVKYLNDITTAKFLK
jgi:hypothetical protein